MTPTYEEACKIFGLNPQDAFVKWKITPYVRECLGECHRFAEYLRALRAACSVMCVVTGPEPAPWAWLAYGPRAREIASSSHPLH